MCETKLKQVQYETEAWQRLLCSMIEENIHLKSNLCEVLKGGLKNCLLEELEIFLNSFIRQDEFINLLRNDLAELNKILKKEVVKDEKIMNEINRRVHEFRNEILIAERRSSDLKIDFNNYLSAMMVILPCLVSIFPSL